MTTLVGCSAHTATPLKTSEPTGPLKVSAVSLRFSAPSVERLRLLSEERVAYTRKAIGSQELVVRSLSTGVIKVVVRLADPGIFQWLATDGKSPMTLPPVGNTFWTPVLRRAIRSSQDRWCAMASLHGRTNFLIPAGWTSSSWIWRKVASECCSQMCTSGRWPSPDPGWCMH
jgi:hypothetical protein